MLAVSHMYRPALGAAIAVAALMLSAGTAHAVDLRDPNLRGADTAPPSLSDGAMNGVLIDPAVDAAPITPPEPRRKTPMAVSAPVEAMVVPVALTKPTMSLRGTDESMDAPEPDLTALTNAIPEADVMDGPDGLGTFRDGYTLSGPPRAEASVRVVPNASKSMTVLGRDLTGTRNPRSSTLVLMGR